VSEVNRRHDTAAGTPPGTKDWAPAGQAGAERGVSPGDGHSTTSDASVTRVRRQSEAERHGVAPVCYASSDQFQVMPPLSADEYAALKADIAERGVQVPVSLDQAGRVLDGHHRKQIAEELNLPYDRLIQVVADDEEARAVALKLNLARRHLNREQRRMLIAAELKHDDSRSNREIARLLGVDHKTVGEVRAEMSGEIPHRRLKQLLDRADYTPYEPHPVLDALPLVDVDQFAAIVASVKRYGLILPITLNHDRTVIVDGRIRFLACQAAGVEPRFRVLDAVYDDPDLAAYAISMNLCRASLSESQRALVATRMPDEQVSR